MSSTADHRPMAGMRRLEDRSGRAKCVCALFRSKEKKKRVFVEKAFDDESYRSYSRGRTVTCVGHPSQRTLFCLHAPPTTTRPPAAPPPNRRTRRGQRTCSRHPCRHFLPPRQDSLATRPLSWSSVSRPSRTRMCVKPISLMNSSLSSSGSSATFARRKRVPTMSRPQ